MHYDQLYSDEAAQLSSDVANGNSAATAGTFFSYYNGATNVFVKPATWASKGKSTDAGYAFSWCNTEVPSVFRILSEPVYAANFCCMTQSP